MPRLAPAWKDLAYLTEDDTEKLKLIEKGLAAQPDAETRGMLQINKALVLEKSDHAAATRLLGEVALDPKSTIGTAEMAKTSLASPAKHRKKLLAKHRKNWRRLLQRTRFAVAAMAITRVLAILAALIPVACVIPFAGPPARLDFGAAHAFRDDEPTAFHFAIGLHTASLGPEVIPKSDSVRRRPRLHGRRRP